MFTMLLESNISLNRNYRRFRHVWRIVAVPTFAYFIAIDLTDSSMVILVTLTALAVATHFFSRRLDRGYPEESVTVGDAMGWAFARMKKIKRPDWTVSKRQKRPQAEA